MCMGYAKEISTWVCDEARSQREVMLGAWSQVFEESANETDMQTEQCLPPSPLL
jgi:hypothetical protein